MYVLHRLGLLRLILNYHFLISRFALRTIAHWSLTELPFILMLMKMEVLSMLIIWGGSLAVFLNKLWRSMCRIEKVKDDYKETVKRYGVYYFCIDDLPL